MHNKTNGKRQSSVEDEQRRAGLKSKHVPMPEQRRNPTFSSSALRLLSACRTPKEAALSYSNCVIVIQGRPVFYFDNALLTLMDGK